MSRLKRLEEFRFVGVRDSMLVYDTDDPAQSEHLGTLIAEGDLINRKLVQTFGPDSLLEARNRGFRPSS